MQRVVAFVGYSGAGKTTLISGLIRHLTAAGVSVGAVKHTHHSIANRRPGGDTDAFLAAGAKQAIFADNWNAMMFEAVGPGSPETAPPTPVRIFSYNDPLRLPSLMDVDIVLVEGFKATDGWPRILVNRRGVDELRLDPDSVLAEVSDNGGAIAHTDIETLAGLVQRAGPISELAGTE